MGLQPRSDFHLRPWPYYIALLSANSISVDAGHNLTHTVFALLKMDVSGGVEYITLQNGSVESLLETRETTCPYSRHLAD
jgi:hypothetical protein